MHQTCILGCFALELGVIWWTPRGNKSRTAPFWFWFGSCSHSLVANEPTGVNMKLKRLTGNSFIQLIRTIKEVSCAVMIQGLLLRGLCHTLFNGLIN